MGKSDHCCVGHCSNLRSKPHLIQKRGHITGDMRWFRATTEEKIINWQSQIRKGRADFFFSRSMKVCANHFVDGEPTKENPNPTLFLTGTDYKFKRSPKKRKHRPSEIMNQQIKKKPSNEEKLIPG